MASGDTPTAIVKALGVVSAGLRDLDDDMRVQASIVFGAPWGEQVHRAIGWQWVLSFGDKDDELFALVSPDRAFYVSALYLFLPYATGAQDEDTSVLLFNLLQDVSQLPKSDPFEFRELA